MFRCRWTWVLVALLVTAQAGRGEPAKPAETPRVDRHGDPLPLDALSRLGTRRWRAESEFYSVAFAPDGKTLTSIHADGTFRVWDAATGTVRAALKAQIIGEPLLKGSAAVAASPNGRLHAAGGAKVILLVDAATGNHVRRIAVPAFASSIAFAPDSKSLASVSNSSDDTLVRLWDVATGSELRTFAGHDSGPYALAFCPDGKHLATCGDRTLRVWDVATGKEKYKLESRNGPRGLAFSPDGKTLASAFESTSNLDSEVRLLDAATGKTLRTIDVGGPFGRSLAFSPDGKTLAGTPNGQCLCLWEIATSKPVSMTTGHTDKVRSTSFSADGKSLISHAFDSTTRLWDVRTGAERRSLRVHYDRLLGIGLSPDHQALATGRADGSLQIEDLTGPGKMLALKGHAARTEQAVFSPDGKVLATTGQDRIIRLWAADTGQVLLQLEDSNPGTLAFVADGKVLLSGANTTTLILRDAATGKVLHSFPARPYAVHPIIAADRRRFLLRDPKAVTVWDAATAKDVSRLPVQLTSSSALALSPDGSLVASADGDARVRLWEVATGKERRTIEKTGHIRLLRFSPDGRLLACVGDTPVVWLFEVGTGEEAVAFTGHTGKVQHLDFSADGRLLASTGTDTTVLVWDLTLASRPSGPPFAAEPRTLEALWSELAAPDAARAYRALAELADGGNKAANFLGGKLRPIEDQRIRPLIADLDSEQFTVREAAQQALAALGVEAEDALRDLGLESKSAEVRRRAKVLLDALEQVRLHFNPEAIRRGRAIQVLERIGSPAARKVLTTLAGGDSFARQTRDAKAALGRLDQRSAGKP